MIASSSANRNEPHHDELAAELLVGALGVVGEQAAVGEPQGEGEHDDDECRAREGEGEFDHLRRAAGEQSAAFLPRVFLGRRSHSAQKLANPEHRPPRSANPARHCRPPGARVKAGRGGGRPARRPRARS